MRPCPVLSKAAQDVRRAAVLFNFAARGARVCNRPTLGPANPGWYVESIQLISPLETCVQYIV
jgi:hypothetical protein